MLQALTLQIAPDSDDYPTLWRHILSALSDEKTTWQVDGLDCLYESDLTAGRYATNELLAAMKDNRFIASARLIALPRGQALSRPIHTIDDLAASNCENLVLCADPGFFDVFSKHADRLDRLSQAFADGLAQLKLFHDVRLIGRTDLLA